MKCTNIWKCSCVVIFALRSCPCASDDHSRLENRFALIPWSVRLTFGGCYRHKPCSHWHCAWNAPPQLGWSSILRTQIWGIGRREHKRPAKHRPSRFEKNYFFVSNNQQCLCFVCTMCKGTKWVPIEGSEHGMRISHFNNFGFRPRPLAVTNKYNNRRAKAILLCWCLSVCLSLGRRMVGHCMHTYDRCAYT